MDLSKYPDPILPKRMGGTGKPATPKTKKKKKDDYGVGLSLSEKIRRKENWIEFEKTRVRRAYLPIHERMLEAMKRRSA